MRWGTGRACSVSGGFADLRKSPRSPFTLICNPFPPVRGEQEDYGFSYSNYWIAKVGSPTVPLSHSIAAVEHMTEYLCADRIPVTGFGLHLPFLEEPIAIRRIFVGYSYDACPDVVVLLPGACFILKS